MSTVPQVMLSSTFFDLKQIRADLAKVIEEEFGCSILASEAPSFPIDPDINTVENCRKRVEHDADLLILIIGGRYGYVDSASAKSVTNLEYLQAKAKGIPIYAFVERKVLTALALWHDNKNANFSAVVDDPRIFEFVHEVRDRHKIWTREFEFADDIVSALRYQFAYLLLQGASLVRRTRGDRDYSVLRELSGLPLRIALEQSDSWEYILFAEILIKELRARRTLNEQRRLGITYGAYEWIENADLHSWTMPRTEELKNLVHALEVLINQELPRALGPSGEPGDIELLVFCARSFAASYEQAIEWQLRVRRTIGEEDVMEVMRTMDCFVDDILKEIEDFGLV